MKKIVEGSFRDPSGFLYYQDGEIYRQVNHSYKENYEILKNSGLYETLAEQGLLVCHQEVKNYSDEAYVIIKPESIPFISYPYEWCFNQLKDAALTTLKVQKIALQLGMTLKDSSAYNIQFKNRKPIFIDTLSFEKYIEGKPWIGYQQFCQHFLAPLFLIKYKDWRLIHLAKEYLDGIPIDLASALLPYSTYLNSAILLNIHLHSKSLKHFQTKQISTLKHKLKYKGLIALLESLEIVVKDLKWSPKPSIWDSYYDISNYSESALNNKKVLCEKFVDYIKPKNAWDFGSNIGIFSEILARKKILTISFDNNMQVVERNYQECKKRNEIYILPLLLDLTNPSPSIGWHNKERLSLIERGTTDMCVALAIIHHLLISNNLPMEKIAGFLNQVSNSLIIEFIPKNDSQVQKLLSSRQDIYVDYTQESFEAEFKKYFSILEIEKISDSERTLYLMVKHNKK